MCYSSQVLADYQRYVREFGARLDYRAFYELFWRRAQEAYRASVLFGTDLAFLDDPDPQADRIKDQIRQYRDAEHRRLGEELAKQRLRLATAEAALLKPKPTKKAADDQRIATKKIQQLVDKLADLGRTEPRLADARMFPFSYVPVMVEEDGQRVVRPMRYHCRPSRAPAAIDQKYPGLYNARRDNLTGFWREQFGRTHGVVLSDAFYEHVNDAVLKFRPRDGAPMLLACLWSRWVDPDGQEPDLLSFALVTDEPPPEVRAAGHDRCVIPLKPENLDAWLAPDPSNLLEQQIILDDRRRPYFDHEVDEG